MVSLFENKIRKRHEASVVIDKVNPLVGYGVFAKEFIPELSYIGEYAGELRARRGRKDRENDYIFGYMVGMFRAPWVVDASKMGNFTRFLNHSFDANVTSRGVVVDSIYHIIFFANRSIAKGEQLTYDYGPTYWNKRPYPQEF
jgi:SET domain-containing protein